MPPTSQDTRERRWADRRVASTGPSPLGGLAARADDLGFEALISAYVDEPSAVARQWLHALVEERLAQSSCRYLLLTGETGSGKTAFMAALARAHSDWLRYFIRADSMTPLSAGDTVSVMMRIGHQFASEAPTAFNPDLLEVVVTQRIGKAQAGADVAGVRIEDLRVSPFLRTAIRVEQDIQLVGGRMTAIEISQATLEPRILEPGTLAHLALLDPAAALARIEPERTVVVLIDALDELAIQTGGNSILDWLADSPELPANLRIVLTSRPGRHLDSLRTARAGSIEEIVLEDRQDLVLGDVRIFAGRLFTEIDAAYPDLLDDRQRAAAALANAAQGNFAYLTAYERALKAALANEDRESIDELLAFEALPAGLQPLYAGFVARLRRQVDHLGQLEVAKPSSPDDELVPAWGGVAQRLLGVLAVARAPVTLPQMMGMGAIRVFQSAANEVLRCFLPLLEEADGTFSFFHGSFRDYLTGSVPSGNADPLIDAGEWNRRILNFYRRGKAWSEVDWHATDDYGLVHVVEHLAASQGDEPISTLLCRSLRQAALERFLSDLPFRRVVEVARARVANDAPGQVVIDAIFCELLVAGLTLTAELDPAVFGLMARLGRVREALGRAQVLPPGLHKFRSLEAIRICTPAELRAELGPNDGAELLVAVALDVPKVSTQMFGDFNATIIGDAAAALAPHDLDRALELIARRDRERDFVPDEDEAMITVLRAAPPERARALLERLGSQAAMVAVDFAERMEGPSDRAAWISIAYAHLEAAPFAERLLQLARLAVLEAENEGEAADTRLDAIRALHAAGDKDADEFRLAPSYQFCTAARLLRPLDSTFAETLVGSLEVETVDSGSSYVMRELAETRAGWGQADRARTLLERALVYHRGLGWWGPARDIAAIAAIATTFDPSWAQQLADEAEELVAPVIRDPDDGDEARLGGVLSGMAESFRPFDRARALRAARASSGRWALGANWDSMDGRGGIAMLGLDVVGSDPQQAMTLLNECLADSGRDSRFGRDRMITQRAGLFRMEDGRPSDPGGAAIASAMNYANYWIRGREWRVFESPADVPRSMAAVFPSGVSWGMAIAGALEAASAKDPDAAIALVGRLGDASDRLVGLAGIGRTLAFAGDQGRLDKILPLIIPTANDQPAYKPMVDFDEMPQAPVFQYLHPTSRARFEAALLLEPLGEEPARPLIFATGSEYLELAWQAQAVADEYVAWVLRGELPQGERESYLAFLRDTAGKDSLLADVTAMRMARWTAAADPEGAEAIRALISAAEYRTAAGTPPLADGLPPDLPPLHAAAAVARQFEEGAGVDAYTAPAVREAALRSLADAGALMRVRGTILLAGASPVAEAAPLLAQALHELDGIENVYLRGDAASDLLEASCWAQDSSLLAQAVGRVIQGGWWQLMEGLRRSLPALVQFHGVEIIDEIDGIIRRAAMVLDHGPAAHEHLDGVWPKGRGVDLIAPKVARPPPTPAQLALYLDEGDLPPPMKLVQDSRDSKPDPDDDQFDPLGGIHTGFCAWVSDAFQPIWRLVDIRFVFSDPASASAYHRIQLPKNSEGQPPVSEVEMVGEECHVFGGTRQAELNDVQMAVTSYFYIYRVGSVVVKLFAAQGVESQVELQPKHLLPLAKRIAERIEAAG